MVLSTLLDASAHYASNQTHLLKTTTMKARPTLKARGMGKPIVSGKNAHRKYSICTCNY